MLEEADQIELLRLARITLQSYLSEGAIPQYHTSRHGLRVRSGVFVSLHRGETLRGCIGQLTADRELYRVVQHCAVSAATEDNRFAPLTEEELPEIRIEVSVLTPFRKIRDFAEIEVGRHGLYIVRGPSRGLLLPQVATHYGWDREIFLEQTCRKAGLPDSAWSDAAATVYLFEAQVFSET